MIRLDRPLAALSIAAAILTAAAPTWAQKGDVSDHPMIGDPAPAFELASTNGDTLSLEGWKGKYVVLHFGASW